MSYYYYRYWCPQDVIDQEQIEWDNMNSFMRDNFLDYKYRRARVNELFIEYYDAVYGDVIPDDFDWSKPHNNWD